MFNLEELQKLRKQQNPRKYDDIEKRPQLQIEEEEVETKSDEEIPASTYDPTNPFKDSEVDFTV
jgi:hypothetical protein